MCDHYDRGNDFYRSFLGPLMVYTSGLQYNDSDTLEDMQYQKLREVCNKVSHLQKYFCTLVLYVMEYTIRETGIVGKW